MIAGDPVCIGNQRTIHRVSHHLTVVPDAVVTVCGLMGMPRTPSAGHLLVLRKCSICRKATFEEQGDTHECP